MKRRILVGGVAVMLFVGMGWPAAAEPSIPRPVTKVGRFKHLDVAQLSKIVNLPTSLRKDQTVSALVQLTGDSVAVQQEKAPTRFNKAAALRRVQATQEKVIPQLTAAGAHSYGQLETVLNAVQVRVKVSDLSKVAAVRGVRTVQVSKVVHADNARSERFTGVDKTWQDLKLTGKGQVIGIIDTGIDYTHADFGGPGTVAAYKANDGTIIEKGSFPTAKVIGGYDFVGDAYAAGSSDPANTVPKPDPDPLDCEGHGSHVAGTAAGAGVTSAGKTYAGPYNRSTLSKTFKVEPGVAPEAKLRAYRVFGCDGTTNTDVIIAAIDRAAADGVDVINMSLGAAFGTARDLDAQAVQAATKSGVLVVMSAGNSGPGAYLVGSPGTATAGLTVAAVDAEFPAFPGVVISGAASGSGIIANGVTVAHPITGELVDVGLGCAAADYAAVAGKIALATRGVCPRVDRATLGQAAHALAVIMINNEDGLPPFEGDIPGVTIPFIGVTSTAGVALKAAVGQQITITQGADIANPEYTNAAGFTSNGPRRLDDAQKPDVAAPGVSIPSVAFGTGTDSIRFSGTSMASPHTAGVAALVRQAHPGWTATQAKAAIMSTAAPDKVGSFDSQRVGTGLVQPRRATATKAYAWTGSGLNSLRFGMHQLNGAYTAAQTYKVTNKGKTATFDLSTTLSRSSLPAQVAMFPRVLTVKSGQTRTVSVRIHLSASAVANLPGASASDVGIVNSLHGLVVAKPRRGGNGGIALRTAFMSVPVPVSDIRASLAVKPTLGAGTATGKITVHNRGVHAGTADVYSWLLSDLSGDAPNAEVADLTDLGVQSFTPRDATDRLMVFAAAQARGTSTQATHDIEVFLDTNGDHKADYVTIATDTGLALTGFVDGTVSSLTFNLATKALVDAWGAVAPANGSTVEMPVLASALKVTAASAPIGISAAGFSIVANGADPMPGTATFDPFSPALSQGDFVTVDPGKSTSIPVMVDLAEAGRQTHSGWLVVSLDDRAGHAEADRVRLVLPAAVAPLADPLGRAPGKNLRAAQSKGLVQGPTG